MKLLHRPISAFWLDSGQILRHQYGISVAESQMFLLVKCPSAAMSKEKRLPFAGYKICCWFDSIEQNGHTNKLKENTQYNAENATFQFQLTKRFFHD